MDCDICKKQRQVINGLCAICYHKQYIDPLQKERENTLRIADQLTNQIKHFARLLNEAVAQTDNRLTISQLDQRMMDRRRKVANGSIDALTYIYCSKCNEPFESGVECITHEGECAGKVRVAKAPKHAKRVATVQAPLTDTLDGME